MIFYFLQVFSAFGFVHKITTFEKTAGFQAFGPVLKIAMFDKNGGLQALIQYPDI
nr:polypyrimidine tract-binding protein homolog 2 isoform X2 [Ipomoea batatas]